MENAVPVVCDKLMNYWDQIRNYLQQKVSAEGYDNWLKGTAFAGYGRRHSVRFGSGPGNPGLAGNGVLAA